MGPVFDEARAVAEEDGEKITELIERLLAVYLAERKARKDREN